MFTDWIHWLSSLHPDELWLVLGGLLLVDGPRYAISQILMCLWDCARSCIATFRPAPVDETPRYCPTVCVVLAGYNEAKTIDATLHSLWGSYPNLQIIVVNDGSLDVMLDVARNFAASHSGVLVLTRDRRGGKSSALNSALPYTDAEIIVTVDTDSHLAPGALWEIVQPLRDPTVGAVSATVRARNAFTNLVTWLQTYEYLQTIFVGRLLAARLGMLGIVSGAFGAFRREALERVGGWDVGPGEDGDLTLRIRKIGYNIAFAPDAQCYSNVPTTWRQLFNQRRRWDRTIITFECRKHIDMAYFWQPHFRWSELLLLSERWFFNIVCLYGLWGYLAWLLWGLPEQAPFVLLSLYLCYVCCEIVGSLSVLYYTQTFWRDAATCLIFPLVPLYQVFLKAASVVAVTEELLFRQSFRDNFVPQHVRDATWHW
jgi:biofilm PGA synthesis N-glycosyltransferase PgaC